MNKKQRIRINENQLKRIVNESVKRVIKEYYADDSYEGQLTVGELINELQKCNPEARAEVYVGNNTFKTISNVHLNNMFLDGREYEEWMREQEDAINNPRTIRGYDHGEDFA